MQSPFPDSMFETFGGRGIGPSPDELRQQAEEAQRISKVNFKQYVSRIYDLRNADDVRRYETDMQILVDGIARRTHVMFSKDKQFVPTASTWIVSVEWGEFELQTQAVEPIKPIIPPALTDEQRAQQGLETYGKDSTDTKR